MMHMNPPDYDVLGIGLGPSNLALAIALDEANRVNGAACNFHFLERQPRFTWHGGMLLPGSDMQISFLKDLVSLRDPTSPLTFVNYLHKQGRLEDFANCKTFYPSRVEFNDYLRWVADSFASSCSYGETVIAVEPVQAGGTVTALRVVSRSASGRESVRQTRGLVVAVGGAPHIPALFKPLYGDPRMLHSSRYLDLIGERGLERPGARVAVIGGGQSAAEITVDLQARFPETRIDLIFRGHSLKPSDSSPFVNEIFHPSYTDFMYDLSEDDREAVVRTFRNTNYAVVDPDLLEALHKILYQQKVEGGSQINLMPRSQITTVTAGNEGIAVAIEDRFAEASQQTRYDAVILATGYERSLLQPFLEPIADHVEDLSVDRSYRLKMRDGFLPRIHLQGYSEASHGLSDTLLSVLAIRSQEIAKSIATMTRERCE
ncbi:lysine N(6)-hydroxylase/L-ornithine N(5)-oxygenase family protein [Methylobacterium brachythecii]|uniref:L-ornithine N(5)-monooxygenase n=1 Tax=Methylobacterium brachythecii TaxID=1176177 RepID=A0A7W6ATE5_9HYPH|nr:lysine N(6)-hydroxylase/L-ornithine N(5)-oxygenase family protein [Methylobacterium brachythecii]MBB3905657.1 L-ornithine N5-oxygenase [Methylobacterium brachythecii]GLS46913.1 L-ornithine N(5)-monooxygenase [Methylobacterium brachythecii]